MPTPVIPPLVKPNTNESDIDKLSNNKKNNVMITAMQSVKTTDTLDE